MCGIVGYLSFSNQLLQTDCLLKKMSFDINHRGPDDEGYYFSDWVGLGFKRLSILDISFNGHQPMADETNNYVIVLNGEIYNFKYLREQLCSMGYLFKSMSDTEVVLKGYMAWGVSVFSKLQGMFAIVIHDKLKNEVVIARDQLGIKPIYFYRNSDFVLFASEIKSLRHKVKFEVNKNKLYEQFIYGYVSGESTIFKDIFRLMPGTYHVYNSKGYFKECEYFNILQTISIKKYHSLTDEKVKQLLNDSILQHTVSDVGFNIQLSGGIDSSYITAVLSSNSKQNIHTYSVSISGYENDESYFQNYVAKKYKTLHHSFNFSASDLFLNYEKATWHHDIPIVHPSSVFLMLLCNYSRETSKVILTGEGADELFGGYSRYQFNKRHLFFSQLAKYPKIRNILPNIYKFKNLKKYLINTEFGIDEAVYFSIDKEVELIKEFEKDLKYRKSVTSKFDTLVHKIVASDQTSYLSWLLERQDKMSMAAGVESRVPFCNHELFNQINKIDPQWKILPLPKAPLKRLAGVYFDDKFIYRRKNGFVLPLNEWMKKDNGLKGWLDLLTDSTFKNRGYYNNIKIEKMVDQLIYKGVDNSKYLMNIINFEIWHRLYIDK
jgi:asparagine synthase (glutamine-hydrolysing)